MRATSKTTGGGMKPSRVRSIVALASFASLVVSPLLAQSAFVDVGTLGFGSSYLLAVNNRGDAVGYSEVTGLDSNRAMLWRDGRLSDLGVLPGMMLSVATDINDRGDVVGWSSEYQYQNIHAVVWRDGQIIDLTPPGDSCRASDINNRGDIVGTCGSGAVLWRDGAIVHLQGLAGGGGGSATAINDAGVIAGTIQGVGPVLWVNGTPTALPLPPDAVGAVVAAINERRQVVGYVVRDRFYDPVLWENGQVKPLGGAWGTVFGYARGINNRGEIAVHAFVVGPITEYGGHVWRDGIFRHLESSTSVDDIDDRGVAVGRVETVGGFESHGAIWPKAGTRIPVDGGVR
jgi:probable HAF family extracellular repeat protein